MLIKMYKTTDSNNTINKTLTDVIEKDIKFKESVDINNPTIKLKLDDLLIEYNYCYIPKLKRYYFISSIVIDSNDILILHLKCDVLESFKSEILECSGYVTRKTDENGYYNSSDYEFEVRKECTTFFSDVTIVPDKNIIMVVIK